jgi:undecaprenol kinase/diacylglycerol kinase (ATP)
LVLAVGLVWLAECFNTALETIVDLASPDIHPLAKISKDVAAAGVLVAALIAVGLGLLLLGPPVWAHAVSWFRIRR